MIVDLSNFSSVREDSSGFCHQVLNQLANSILTTQEFEQPERIRAERYELVLLSVDTLDSFGSAKQLLE